MKMNNCKEIVANFEEGINFNDWVIMNHQWGVNNGGGVYQKILP